MLIASNRYDFILRCCRKLQSCWPHKRRKTKTYRVLITLSAILLVSAVAVNSQWSFTRIYSILWSIISLTGRLGIFRKSLAFGTKGLPIFEPSPSLEECIQIVDGNVPSNFKGFSLAESEDDQIKVTCEEIKRRGNYKESNRQAYSIAHIRIVYQDYHVQELVFSLLYSPENIFCYYVDVNAPRLFQEQMQNFSNCFPNVYIAPAKHHVTSSGRNMDRAYLACLSLIRNVSDWQYATMMQNYDIPVKTNVEMIEILKRMNGSNSVVALDPIQSRIPKHNDWSFKGLNFFKDPLRNDDRKIQFTKGNIGAVLSRAFVNFVVDEINATTFLSRFDKISYGGDEAFFPSLNADDNIEAPGGFTRRCINRNAGYIARFASWGSRRQSCRSQKYRHGICIFGYKDLPMFKTKPFLFANKMIPSYDYAGIVCWAQYLLNRANNPHHINAVNLDYYARMPNVLFHNQRAYWKTNLSLFDCGGESAAKM